MQDTGTDNNEFRLSEHIAEARHGYSEMQKCTVVLIRKLPDKVNSRLSALWIGHGTYELFNLVLLLCHDIEIISSLTLPAVSIMILSILRFTSLSSDKKRQPQGQAILSVFGTIQLRQQVATVSTECKCIVLMIKQTLAPVSKLKESSAVSNLSGVGGTTVCDLRSNTQQ
jgi:hypothetical protein